MGDLFHRNDILYLRVIDGNLNGVLELDDVEIYFSPKDAKQAGKNDACPSVIFKMTPICEFYQKLHERKLVGKERKPKEGEGP